MSYVTLRSLALLVALSPLTGCTTSYDTKETFIVPVAPVDAQVSLDGKPISRDGASITLILNGKVEHCLRVEREGLGSEEYVVRRYWERNEPDIPPTVDGIMNFGHGPCFCLPCTLTCFTLQYMCIWPIHQVIPEPWAAFKKPLIYSYRGKPENSIYLEQLKIDLKPPPPRLRVLDD